MDNLHPEVEKIVSTFDAITAAVTAKRRPTDEETVVALTGAIGGLLLGINAVVRIADALEKIANCADGVHPSAFRIVKQG